MWFSGERVVRRPVERLHLPLVTNPAVQLGPFDECITLAISDESAARSTGKTFRMKLVIARQHDGACDDLTTVLTRFAISGPVIVFTKQQAIFLEVPGG